jgi:hypothetical protein
MNAERLSVNGAAGRRAARLPGFGPHYRQQGIGGVGVERVEPLRLRAHDS